MTAAINTDYARKNEGYIYGEGTASLAQNIAENAAGLKTARGQARAAHNILRRAAARLNMNPDIEVFMRDEGNFIRVSWESGPYEWAIVASDALCQVGVFAEPHYSFDLCFYPSEDRA